VKSSSALVSVIVWPLRPLPKAMVSPLLAVAMSARSEPEPRSVVVHDRQRAEQGAVLD